MKLTREKVEELGFKMFLVGVSLVFPVLLGIALAGIIWGPLPKTVFIALVPGLGLIAVSFPIICLSQFCREP